MVAAPASRRAPTTVRAASAAMLGFVVAVAGAGVNSTTRGGVSTRGGSSNAATATPRDAVLPTAEAPLAFEPNAGQAPASARYVVHADGGALLISPVGVSAATSARAPVTVLQLTGGDPAAVMTSDAPEAGIVSYLEGRDPSRWLTGLRTFADVTAHNVYPGVDVRYHGAAGQLEYDFIVAPGGNPDVIALRFAPRAPVTLDAAGDLVVTEDGATVMHHRPVAYQMIGAKRRAVPAAFQLTRRGAVRIAVGPFDHGRPLVIDPAVSYSTYLGGHGDDRGLAVAADGAGSAYVTGVTASVAFPTTTGAFDTVCGTGAKCNATTDVFVSKLNASGTGLVYTTYIGGSGLDQPADIAVDPGGDAYITGQTQSTDFPTTPGALHTSCGTDAACNPDSLGPASDAFLTILNAGGTSLRYSTYLGGRGRDVGFAVAAGPGGAAYVAGRTASADFPVTSGAFDDTCGTDAACNGSGDAFLSVIDPAGAGVHDLVYSTYLGGSGAEAFELQETFGHAVDLAVDSAGVVYMTGNTSSADFPVTGGAYQTSLHGDSDAFVAEVDPSRAGDGTGVPSASNPALLYSTYLGGATAAVAGLGSANGGLGIALAGPARVAVAGFARATDFPVTSGAVQSSLGGCSEHAGCDGFVAVLNLAGAGAGDLVYSTYLGGSVVDRATDVAVDATGRLVVTGMTVSTTFPTHDATQPVCGCFLSNAADAFVTVINPEPTRTAASNLVFSTFLGGTGADIGMGVALNGSTGYVNGYSDSPGTKRAYVFKHPVPFPTTAGAVQTRRGGSSDAFVTSFTGV